MVIGMFWLGWISRVGNSPIFASVGGVFIGFAFQMIFMSMLNYITDIFREGSASAHAAAACLRSICAILVPLGGPSMYQNLGVPWASSLLGFLSLLVGIIPFVLLFFGHRVPSRRRDADIST
jgi:hypothetical protein